MFSNVLVGIDGGEGGRDALALARQLAAPGAQLTLAGVWSTRDAMASAITGRAHPATAGHELLEHLRAAEDLDCRVVQISAGSPQQGLHELAEQSGADLLVVGASRHGDGERHLLGDHARGALHGASCAVAVAAPGFAGAPRIGDIGVAWDGGASARAALAQARTIAGSTGARLHGMSVVAPLPGMFTPELVAYAQVLDDTAGEEVRRRRTELEALGLDVVRAGKGIAAVELCEWSEEVDLLVLGSRGFGPVRRLFLGSTGDAVVRHARTSVLVLPRPEQAELEAAREAAIVSAD